MQFVAHPNIQQLLASIWYEGLPGFRRKSPVQKLMEIVLIALAFPFYCLLYMVAPSTSSAQLMKKPFMKFLIHASSYLFFLRNIGCLMLLTLSIVIFSSLNLTSSFVDSGFSTIRRAGN